MIRVVLAVALASALLGTALPSAERADRERNTAIATAEIEALADTATRLAAENDAVGAGQTPAAATVTVDVPQPTLADGGRIEIRNDGLRWDPFDGRTRTVDPPVPLHVESPIVLTDRTRIRLSLVRIGGRTVVSLRRDDPSV